MQNKEKLLHQNTKKSLYQHIHKFIVTEIQQLKQMFIIMENKKIFIII